MNNSVDMLFDSDEYYQTYISPFPVFYGSKNKKDDDMELDPLDENPQPDILVRLYLGSLTIVGLYILFRVLD